VRAVFDLWLPCNVWVDGFERQSRQTEARNGHVMACGHDAGEVNVGWNGGERRNVAAQA